MRGGKTVIREVLYTQDSRLPSGYDATWSATAGFSVVFPSNVNAADFEIPMGFVAKVTAVMWHDNPMIFVPNENNVPLSLFVNGQGIPVLRRTTTVGSQANISQLSAGFMQGDWIGIFLRLDQGDILTLSIGTALVYTQLKYKIRATLEPNTGNPINEEFTNKERI